MRLSKEATEALKNAVREAGLSDTLERSTDQDLEELGSFLLNLMAAAIKTRERLRMLGRELPASTLAAEAEEKASQPSLPGLGD